MSKHPMVCDLCEEGTLEQKQGVNTVTYKTITRELSTDYCECDTCGVEMTLPHQTRDNKRRMVAFKKEVDGFLTGFEVRALRERLGFKQADAAKVFGGGVVAFSKYENDDVTQSEAMDKLMRLADEVPEAREHLLRSSGVKAQTKSNVIYAKAPQWQVLAGIATNEGAAKERFAEVAENAAKYNYNNDDWVDCEEC